MIKKIINELIVIIYVHICAAPIALVSFGFIAIMMLFTWSLLNVV